MDIVSKRDALIAKHKAELIKLEKEAAVASALLGAGLPEPDFVCIHADHASVSWYPDGVSYRRKYSPAEAIGLLKKLEPFIVKMEPALKDGLFRSLGPVCARGKGEYSQGGVEFDIELSQSLYGESANSALHGPQYSKIALSLWASVGGQLIEASLEIEGLLGNLRVYYSAAHGGAFIKPLLRSSKMFSFGGGGKYSADVRYLFSSIEDCEAALAAKVAA